MRRSLLLTVLLAACTGTSAPKAETPDAPPTTAVEPAADASAQAEQPTAPPPELAEMIAEAQQEPILPRPFSAADIRDGMPLGTTRIFRMTAAGRPDVTSTWEVVDHDPQTATFQFTEEPEGLPSKTTTRKSAWQELRDHATYPTTNSTRHEETIEVGAGKFDVWTYETTNTPDGSMARFHFAKTLPGPPVLHMIIKDGAELFRMELISTGEPVSAEASGGSGG